MATDTRELTPEQKLLAAIFGPHKRGTFTRCAKCKRKTDHPIWFNGKPHHSSCLDPEDELE